MQLWILLKQLEEINIQFARFLDTLTIPTTSTPLSNSFEESSRQPDTPTAPTQTKVMTSALPKTPPLTKITTINSRVEQGRAMAWTQPEPLPTSPNYPTLTTQSEPPHSTAVPAMLATKLDHDTHSQHDLMSLLTHIDEQCAELEMIFAQLENHPGMTTMVPQDVPPASSTPRKLRYIITSDPTPTDHQHRFLIPPVTLNHDPLGKKLILQMPFGTQPLTLGKPPWPPHDQKWTASHLESSHGTTPLRHQTCSPLMQPA